MIVNTTLESKLAKPFSQLNYPVRSISKLSLELTTAPLCDLSKSPRTTWMMWQWEWFSR